MHPTAWSDSIAERFVGTARRECLGHMLIFGRRHLESVLIDFIEHYHRARPHQGLEQQLPRPPAEVRLVSGSELMHDDRLGGLIHEYRFDPGAQGRSGARPRSVADRPGQELDAGVGLLQTFSCTSLVRA